MTDEEINYDLLEVEKGNKRYGIYLKNHIQDIQKRSTEMYKENKLLKSQLQQKDNIIKEVREYIESNYFYTSQGMKKANETIFGVKLLEILDKENQ